MKKIILLSILLILMFGSSYGQSTVTGTMEQLGTSVANYLKIGVGARSLGMAGASVASCDDITSLFWNAGALDRVPTSEVIFQSGSWLVDSKIYFLGASYKIQNFGTFGLSINYFTSGDIEETTLLAPEGTGRTFTADDITLGLTYSRKITDLFAAGLTLKWIQESLDSESASAMAIDIGSIFETNFLNNMRIGMSLSNLGGRMRFSGSGLSVEHTSNPGFPTKVIRADLATEEWDIPLFFRLGIATEILKQERYRLTISGEVMDSRDYLHRFSFGTEFAYSEIFFLRAGYKFNYDEQSYALGAGVNIDLSWTKLSIDYAFGDFGVLNNIQRFSLILTY